MSYVHNLLDQYHFSILKDMVQLLDIPPASNKKKGHVDVLAQALFTPEIVQRGLSLLGQRERQALATIQRTEGRIQARRLRLQLLRQGTILPVDDKTRRHSTAAHNIFAPTERRTSFQAIIGRLMAVGLVCGDGIVTTSYSNRTKIQYDNVNTLYIHETVHPLLPAPPPLDSHEFQVKDLTKIDEGSARSFQRDLYFYWSTVRTTPLSLTKQDRLYKKDLRLVNSALLYPQEIGYKDEPDLPRLIFLRLLLIDMELLTCQDHKVRAAEHPHFLGRKPADRIQRTFVHWRDGTFWNEILSIPQITVAAAGTRIAPAPEPIARSRKRVLKHIAELHKKLAQPEPSAQRPADEAQEGTWVPISQLIDHIRLVDYDFLLPRDFSPSGSSYYYAYYGYTSRRSPYISYGNEMGWSFSPPFQDEAEGWEIVEAEFIRSILLEPLYWMGLLDIGYTKDKPTAYRLTSVGEWVLGMGNELEIPEGEGKVVVQPNFEIFALDPISDLTLSKLDEFADRLSAERAIKYQLTRESVYRAQRNHWTAQQIIDDLQKMSVTPMPQNVTRTIQEWQTLHERIVIHRRGSMLQAMDSTLLDQLLANPAVRSHLTTRPDETVALITSQIGETEDLIQSLQEAGYPPAWSQSPRDALRPSFTIDDDGQMHFNIALPSIYLYEQITPFTGRDEQGRYFLTRSAVQEAIARGMTVQDILDRLHVLHLGPLPRWVEIKVRAWGHYYGDAAVQDVILVQIQDKKTLRELLAEPEVQGILRPFTPNPQRALALVSAQDLESLRALLAERGISIQNQLDQTSEDKDHA